MDEYLLTAPSNISAEIAIIEFTVRILHICFPTADSLVYIGEENYYLAKSIFSSEKSVSTYDYTESDYSTHILMFTEKKNLTTLLSKINLRRCNKVVIFTTESSVDLRFVDHVILVFSYSFAKRYFHVKAVSNKQLIAELKHDAPPLYYKSRINDFVWKPSKVCVATCHMPPFVIANNITVFGGFEIDILEHASAGINISYMILPPESWGTAWQLVQDGSCDLAVGGHNWFYWAKESEDATIFYLQFSLTLLVPKPLLLSPELFVFRPLPKFIWLTVIMFIFTAATIYYIFKKYLYQDLPRYSYINVLINVAGTVFLNPRIELIRYIDTNILFMLIMLMSILVATLYTAGIASNIAAPPYENPIDTFKDIEDHSLSYTYSYIPFLFATSSNPTARSIKNLEDLINTKLESQMYTAYKYKKFVIIGDSTVSMERRRSLKVLSEDLAPYGLIFPLTKNSPLKDYYNEKIQHFLDHGLVDAWFLFNVQKNVTVLRQMSGYYSNYKTEIKEHSPLKFVQLQGAFYILFLGHGIALLSLTVEKKTKRKYPK